MYMLTVDTILFQHVPGAGAIIKKLNKSRKYAEAVPHFVRNGRGKTRKQKFFFRVVPRLAEGQLPRDSARRRYNGLFID